MLSPSSPGSEGWAPWPCCWVAQAGECTWRQDLGAGRWPGKAHFSCWLTSDVQGVQSCFPSAGPSCPPLWHAWCLVSGLVVPCGCLQKRVVASGFLKAQVLWWASACTLALNKLSSVQWGASGGTTSTKASCREETSVSSEQGDVLENDVLQSPVPTCSEWCLGGACSCCGRAAAGAEVLTCNPYLWVKVSSSPAPLQEATCCCK